MSNGALLARNMFPSFAPLNVANRHLMDSIMLGYNLLRSIVCEDVTRRFLRELRSAVVSATAKPSLTGGIGHVGAPVTKKHMGWIDASLGVTRMAHFRALGNLALGKFVGDSVGVKHSPRRSLALAGENSISGRADCAPPQPTFIIASSRNFGPESFSVLKRLNPYIHTLTVSQQEIL